MNIFITFEMAIDLIKESVFGCFVRVKFIYNNKYFFRREYNCVMKYIATKNEGNIFF